MPSQIILVTGANRGIGFSIIQATAPRNPTATYLLGCRSIAAGEDAIKELRTLGIESKLDVVELDITNDDSIFAAAEYVKTKYGHLDGQSSSLKPPHQVILMPIIYSLSQQRRHRTHPQIRFPLGATLQLLHDIQHQYHLRPRHDPHLPPPPPCLPPP